MKQHNPSGYGTPKGTYNDGMEGSPWHRTMESLISGIEEELRSSTPGRAKLALNAFRVRLKSRRIAGGRKRFESELESLITETGTLRAAAERYLGTSMASAIDQANTALKKADKLIAPRKARMRLV